MKIVKALTALLILLSATTLAKEKSYAHLEIEGMDIGGVTIIRGPSIETEVIEYQEGNDILLKNNPGKSRFGKIIVSRKMKGEKKLLGWYLKTVSGEAEKRSGALLICDKKGDVVDRYDFEGAWPTRWEGGVNETVTLAVDSVSINVPMAEEEKSSDEQQCLTPEEELPNEDVFVEEPPAEEELVEPPEEPLPENESFEEIDETLIIPEETPEAEVEEDCETLTADEQPSEE